MQPAASSTITSLGSDGTRWLLSDLAGCLHLAVLRSDTRSVSKVNDRVRFFLVKDNCFIFLSLTDRCGIARSKVVFVCFCCSRRRLLTSRFRNDSLLLARAPQALQISATESYVNCCFAIVLLELTAGAIEKVYLGSQIADSQLLRMRCDCISCIFFLKKRYY
jgi:hypothetical protein